MIRVPPGHVLRYGYAAHGRIRFEQYAGVYLPAVQRHLDVVVLVRWLEPVETAPDLPWLDAAHRAA